MEVENGMDFGVLSDFINNIGFPIAVCCAMFWYINKTEERHADEVDTLRASLDANTQAVSKLLDRLNNEP